MQQLLDNWYYEYITNKERDVKFEMFGGVKSDWMGSTSFAHPIRIRIAKYFEGHPFWSEVVLWHEFCHAWAFLDYDDHDHGLNWFRCMLHRPFMFIMQVPCTFVAVFLKN